MSYRVELVTDKDVLRKFFRKDPARYFYPLGDLDPVYFQRSQYWGAFDEADKLKSVVLIYKGAPDATIIPCGEADGVGEILENIEKDESHFRVFCDQEHRKAVEPHITILAEEPYLRLIFRGNPPSHKDPGIMWLTPGERAAVEELLQHYPRAYFPPDALSEGHYIGIWREGQLVGMAGTHLVSEQEQVAALGTVVVYPRFRGNGYATRLIAQMIYDLSRMVRIIGLHMSRNNEVGLKLYGKLGFVVHNHFKNITARWNQ